MVGTRVAVIGASGYLGGELLRVLAGHPGVSLTGAVSHSHGGIPLSRLWPNLPDGERIVCEGDADRLDCDLAFLALPAGEALSLVPSLRARGIRVVDLGPDYRLKDPALYAAVYGRPHTDLEGLAQAVYGLTEWNRDAIRNASLVANPGCYPTASLLALLPLRKKGLLPSHVIIDAKSGTSGAGSALSPLTHHPQASQGVQPYGGGAHRHAPEIVQGMKDLSGAPDAGGIPELTFQPHVVPLVRGILCDIYAPGVAAESFHRWAGTLSETYAGSSFVRTSATIPQVPWSTGSNRCYIASQKVGASGVVYSVLDNLGKGGAGQAIQNANLMLGRPEAEGISMAGLGL